MYMFVNRETCMHPTTHPRNLFPVCAWFRWSLWVSSSPEIRKCMKSPSFQSILKHHCKRLAPGLLGFWLPRCESIASQREVYRPAHFFANLSYDSYDSRDGRPGSDKRSASPQVSHICRAFKMKCSGPLIWLIHSRMRPWVDFLHHKKKVWFPLVSKLQSWFGEGGFNMFNPHGK